MKRYYLFHHWENSLQWFNRLTVLAFSVISIFFALANPTQISATTCRDAILTYTSDIPNPISCGSLTKEVYTFQIQSETYSLVDDQNYSLRIRCTNQPTFEIISRAAASGSEKVSFSIPKDVVDALSPSSVCSVNVRGPNLGTPEARGCDLSPSVKVGSVTYTAQVYISQQRTVSGSPQTCYGFPSGCIEAGIPAAIEILNINKCGQPLKNTRVEIEISGTGSNNTTLRTTDPNGDIGSTFHTFSGAGSYQLLIQRYHIIPGLGANIFKSQLTIRAPGACGDECLTTKPVFSSTSGPDPYKICDQIDSSQAHLIDAYNNCIECVGGSETGTDGIWTAIGCIKRDPTEIVQNLLRVGLGMGGGVALLMILAAGFLFSISQGDPKRTGEAKELITAAITGLLFIIFSVVILQFIGYTVLQIPGFGG